MSSFWPSGIKYLSKNEYQDQDPTSGYPDLKEFIGNKIQSVFGKTQDRKCACVSLCGQNCFNRSRGIECSDDCSAGTTCSNQHVSVVMVDQGQRLMLARDGNKGTIVKALLRFKKGQLVDKYLGVMKIKNHSTIPSLPKDGKNGLLSNYEYDLDLIQDLIIDSRESGSFSRFMSHSCDPNVKFLPVSSLKAYKF